MEQLFHKEIPLKETQISHLPIGYKKWNFTRKHFSVENQYVPVSYYNSNKVFTQGFYKKISKIFPFANEL